jgi:hypothetical protein
MVSAAGLLASGGYALFASAPGTPTPQTLIGKNGVITQDNSHCRIKGNIQIGTGQRIYHVPGQAYYDETIVSRPRANAGSAPKQRLRRPDGANPSYGYHFRFYAAARGV